jgi:hypothetical protein
MKTEEAEMRLRRQALEPEQTPPDEIHERRIAAARACRAWQELDPADLVERDRGYLVHADTDEAFQVYRGAAFSPSGEIVSDMTPLRFYVDEDGTVVVLELQPDSWSELTYQAARG